MATKADKFKTKQQHAANPPKPKRAPRARRDLNVDTAKPGVSASDRKVGAGRSGSRNVSARAAKKGGAALEDSATGRPSRKSTRDSAGAVKRTSNLRLRAERKTSAPAARAAKARARGRNTLSSK
jgi:hypothetical protein